MSRDPHSFVPTRFRIVRCIGGGATGDVYEAHDKDQGARLAIKTLRNLQPHAIARFKNEFRALQDVDHPNLVNLGELIEDQGELFFTMELVRGVDFLTWVTADPGRLRGALIELCRGLVALHGAGKVHRDVKPSNVLVTAEARVVVLDFGLLTDADRDDTWSGQSIVGTPQYMAPEQAAGQAPGPAADWYAVGVMLYEALTGALPFDGPVMKILLDKQQREPASPASLAPEAPADLAALCQALLRFDPADRPTGEAILRRLGRAPTARQTVTPPTMTQGAPFVGRTDELALLGRAQARCVVERRPQVVLIEGDSGVGKTTLARVFVRGLDGNVAVLAGRCFERESVSYKAFDGVIEELARLLSRMEPAEAAALLPLHAGLLGGVFGALKRVRAFADAPLPDAEVDDREQRDRVFGALRELMIRLAQRRAVVLAIDDLQWADDDSLALLAEVLRPPDAPALLLVATLRPTGSGGDAATAAARVRAVCPEAVALALAPLAPAEARELAGLLVDAHGVAGAVDPEALSREAAGHPLFLDELVRHAASTGASAAGALHLDDVVWARVSALPPKARELVELIALAGHPLHQETIARAVDVAPEAFARMVSSLRIANLVRTSGARPGDTIEPYHDRVRHAIAGRLPPARVVDVHHALAVAIEGSPHHGQDAILAFHWNGAGRTEQAARRAALAGARAADELAFDRAARAFTWALELGHPDRGELLTRLGDACGNAGRGAEAADAYLEAASAVTGDAEALELRRLAAEQLLMGGHIDRGLTLLTKVLGALGMKLPDTPRSALLSLLTRRARLRLRGLRFREHQESAVAPTELTRIDLCWSVATGLAMVDTIRGADFQTRHLLLALRAGEPTRVAKALAVEGGFLSTAGPKGLRRAQHMFTTARALLARTPSAQASALILGAECLAAFQNGRWRAAIDLARQAEHAARSQRSGTGTAWQLDTVHFFWLYALYYRGELGELASRAPELLRAASERGDLYAATNLRVGLCNAAWLVSGKLDEARRHLDEAEHQWTMRDFHLQHYHHLLGLGQARLYAGEAVDGYAELLTRWPALERSLILRIHLVELEAWLLRGRLALATARSGAADAAERLREAERLAARVERSREPYAAGQAALLAAGVAATRGDPERAVAALRRALTGLEAADMTIYASVARDRLGRLLGGDEGAALRASHAAAVAAERIAEPARFAEMLGPGFDP